MKLLLDMNLSPLWVGFLANEGFEAVHWSSIGDFRAPDVTLLEWASARGHTVITRDLDFPALLAATRGKGPSVVLIRTPDAMPDSMGRILTELLRTHKNSLEKGAVMSIDGYGARVRILPVR